MYNGHIPAHMTWIEYKLQLWPGLRYGLGTMTNDLEATETISNKLDYKYKILLILGVVRTVKRELRKLHTTFGGFGLFNLLAEQLICRINMLLQYYHTLTALSRKLDASFRYLQLQLGILYNPLTLPFEKWEHLASLSWLKMLWCSLDKFNIQLHMKYPVIPYPRERDQVIMETILNSISSTTVLQSLNWCRVRLQCISLSDIVTADSKYLENFVFDPGPAKHR
jgi:hypothetical protein